MTIESNFESEFLQEKQRRERATRGVKAQTTFQEALAEWKKVDQNFDFDRLYDTKSCGRFLPQQIADFTGAYKGRALAFEVKQTKEAFKIPRKHFTQYYPLMARLKAGAACFLVVYHSELGGWRVAQVEEIGWLPPDGGFNLEGFPLLNGIDEVMDEIRRILDDDVI